MGHAWSERIEEEPALRSEGLARLSYFDAVTNDCGHTTVIWARSSGAAAALRGSGVRESARRVGVNCQDSITGESFTLRARAAAGAAGPWTDELRAMAGDAPVLRPTKGIHVVVPRERLRTESIVAFFWEGRPFFAVPAGRHTYVGTTDTDWIGDPGEAVATTEDVSSVLAAVNASFETVLDAADVTATWAGVRL
jgi:glycerol-3-phosphate dehydrogenase